MKKEQKAMILSCTDLKKVVGVHEILRKNGKTLGTDEISMRNRKNMDSLKDNITN